MNRPIFYVLAAAIVILFAGCQTSSQLNAGSATGAGVGSLLGSEGSPATVTDGSGLVYYGPAN